jgi:hypothetical protein
MPLCQNHPKLSIGIQKRSLEAIILCWVPFLMQPSQFPISRLGTSSTNDSNNGRGWRNEQQEDKKKRKSKSLKQGFCKSVQYTAISDLLFNYVD